MRRFRVIRPAPKPTQSFSKIDLSDAWNLIEAQQRVEFMLFCLSGIIDWRCVSNDKEIGQNELSLLRRRLDSWLRHCKARLRKELLGSEHPPRWLFEAANIVNMEMAKKAFLERKGKLKT